MKAQTMMFSAIGILSLFGVLFFGVAAEEALHVIQGKGAKSVCVDFNLKMNDTVEQGFLTAHTEFDPTQWRGTAEFYSWRELTEKYASYLEKAILITVPFLLGLFLAKLSIRS